MEAVESQIIRHIEQRMSIPELCELYNWFQSLLTNGQRGFDQIIIKKFDFIIRTVIYQAYAYKKLCAQHSYWMVINQANTAAVVS